MRRAHHQPHAAAHHDAVAPAQEGLGKGVDDVVELVLLAEEAFGVLVAALAAIAQRLVELAQVAAGAEGFLARGLQQYADDLRVGRPFAQPGREQPHHVDRE